MLMKRFAIISQKKVIQDYILMIWTEVYPGIKSLKTEKKTNQMTVGNALFMDMWELCNSD